MRHIKNYGKDNREAVARRGNIRAIQARIAGVPINSISKLPEDDRVAMRKIATEMYDLGVDVATAERAESTDKRGFVYIITHPAFPGYVKIGRAFDAEQRTRQYQTHCPTRSYELYDAVYFSDCYFAEQEIHARLSCLRAEGEWYTMTAVQARSAIETLRQTI